MISINIEQKLLFSSSVTLNG